jgi:hypothetical protein
MEVQEPPAASSTHAAGRERGHPVLLGIGALLLVVLAVVVGSLAELVPDRARPPVGADPSDRGRLEVVNGGRLRAEAELATAPMLDVPPSAAEPHALTTATAGPPITLPAPTRVAGSAVATGFPPTPEGAIAQLAELMTAGMAGGDPLTWARAYDSLAEDGAAPAEQTWTGRDLADLRRGSNMAPTGPLPAGMTISWTPTDAIVKGISDDGGYTVVCVLGEFVADVNGRVVTAGWGNCLPMRLVDGRWRIASGPTAAVAPSAWPGSAEAVAAGWREIAR